MAYGGDPQPRKHACGAEGKSSAMGMAERGGKIEARTVPNVKTLRGIKFDCLDWRTP